MTVDTPVQLGSYPPGDVTFLLTDLTGRIEESSLEEREAAIAGGGHYSERLPVEYAPSDAYVSCFEAALERNARVIARCAAVAAERVLARKATVPVLVSLARAGTPAGILLRRYLAHAHGIDAPHYSVSIIRDRGLDPAAISWLRRQHPEAPMQFVDGWTGKGAIQRELSSAARELQLDDTLAVLADPARCAGISGTTEDVLVPSACLNATVSGLVSRTVIRDDLLQPDEFHGVKQYPELAGADVSLRFVETVAAHFDTALLAEAVRLAAEPSPPVTWSGWRATEAIAAAHGIDDLNRVKPGIGEATRVLLRRRPALLLVRGGSSPDLEHLLQLADEREVPVAVAPDMPYVACGLIA